MAKNKVSNLINSLIIPFIFWWQTIKRSFKFTGRSSRKEFWMFLLGNFITALPIMILLHLFTKLSTPLILLLFVYYSLLLSISLTIRRFHDVGANAWLALVYYETAFLAPILAIATSPNPIINYIISVLFIINLLNFAVFFSILGFVKGTPNFNKYGFNPIEINAVEDVEDLIYKGMSEFEKACRILNVPPEVNVEEIKKVYKALAYIWHPDTGITKNDKKIKKINWAYSFLIDHKNKFGDYVDR